MTKNEHIIEILEQLVNYYKILKDRFRSQAYQNAIETIKDLDFEITEKTLEKVKNRQNIGKGIYEKLNEIIDTGTLQLLQELKENKEIKIYLELSKILGIGKRNIEKFIEKDLYTIKDLKKADKEGIIKLTNLQKLGIKYYEDLQKRIPREEVKFLSDIIKQILLEIGPKLKIETVGSYRRKNKSSGDIDILITGINKEDILDKFKKEFKKTEFYISDIVKGQTRYAFLIFSPKSELVRQVDIRYVPEESYPTALLYFTGNVRFNIQMRNIAKKDGYLLNEYGLYKILPGDKKEQIKVNSERDIFNILDIEYLKPEERNV